ncbi:ribosome assembly RNA-binding protein YhbY [Liquorilactobacillus satsumensis]|uniref:CRM domain-containing protein n=1 Tax=Liquorilactobacillus satsumensis DSM 16230 = JCM 12392 TaxID=1423801 RepID=A0A0R1V8A4_9LACO|nr:ribosome assembly RNA-binding protein YhbY [Liquorilactobacillus satsumensis]KRL99843.1 hypothetical protein FD50_GL002378 [Liquorilactobacillus satsumensis DSM 16230 = JCM 12392]MCC7665667.1 ribosome assembly RNA-binding protein YhbY [Liquorilactobacillus satsumensis]MCP9311879.1 ribosome assembly RNA-binding protein YhbY [Liquorilactobacillus satsumensis]MCP9328321.1 ribosome assembly RNA-binding protein YhbY [Liquorilactobacillus satsumensis]MCP9356540.1 ribosome assembly RNA-binding pro
MITGKQKRYLKAQAHSMRPVFQIGKEGLTDEWFEQVGHALEKRELLKVNVLQGAMLEAKEAAAAITANSEITVVQVIGHVLVLYRQAQDPKNRQISTSLQKITQHKR